MQENLMKDLVVALIENERSSLSEEEKNKEEWRLISEASRKLTNK